MPVWSVLIFQGIKELLLGLYMHFPSLHLSRVYNRLICQKRVFVERYFLYYNTYLKKNCPISFIKQHLMITNSMQIIHLQKMLLIWIINNKLGFQTKLAINKKKEGLKERMKEVQKYKNLEKKTKDKWNKDIWVGSVFMT